MHLDYLRKALTAYAAQPAPIVGDVEKDAAMREAVCEAIAGQLTGLYHCGRVWSAWSLGIMDEDDFSPAEEDIYIISNIAEAAIAAMPCGMRMTTRSPGTTASAWISIRSSPYSSA